MQHRHQILNISYSGHLLPYSKILHTFNSRILTQNKKIKNEYNRKLPPEKNGNEWVGKRIKPYVFFIRITKYTTFTYQYQLKLSA